MTVTQLRPSSVRAGASSFTNAGGAGDHAAALADNSPSTYIVKSATGTASIILNCGTLALSSTQRVRQVRVEANYASPDDTSRANVQLGVRVAGVNYFGAAFQISGVDALNTYLAPYASIAPDGSAWSQALVDEIMVQITDYVDGAAAVPFYEILVDVDVATAPTATVSSPTGTVSTTTRPDVSWAFTDGDGEAQAYYQVRVFTAAQYGAAGFDPVVSAAVWDSGEIASADTTATVGEHLASGTTYRAYVRVGKTLNGSAFWSAYAYSGFTVTLTAPTVPTLATAYSSGTGRVTVTATGAAAAGRDSQTYIVQRSDDAGTTWETVRNGDAVIPAGSYVATLYDYESPRGITAHYRVRAVALEGDLEIASAWSASSTVAVTNDGGWWMKAVDSPALNLGALQVLADPDEALEESVEQYLPMGRTVPLVVSGGLGGRPGTYTLNVSGAAAWTALYALIAYRGTLLVQDPFGQQKYVRLMGRSWVLTGAASSPRRRVTLQYVEVAGS